VLWVSWTTCVGWVGAEVGDLLESSPLLEVDWAGSNAAQKRQSAGKDGDKHDGQDVEMKGVVERMKVLLGERKE